MDKVFCKDCKYDGSRMYEFECSDCAVWHEYADCYEWFDKLIRNKNGECTYYEKLLIVVDPVIPVKKKWWKRNA
jgi:hypothetical protein